MVSHMGGGRRNWLQYKQHHFHRRSLVNCLCSFEYFSYNMWFKRRKSVSTTFRSSRSQMFYKIGVLKISAKFTRKHLCWSIWTTAFEHLFRQFRRISYPSYSFYPFFNHLFSMQQHRFSSKTVPYSEVNYYEYKNHTEKKV